MTFPSLLLLLSFGFLLCLAGLWHFDWTHHGLSPRAAKAAHPMVHRLLKPRTPLDCPACRLASIAASGGELSSAPVRPWGEVKSRRGAPKRVNTEGFACPNQQCPYCGITDAQVHALVGDGKHGHGERIQTFRCQACHTTFSARRNTPLYRLKTPSHSVAMVLSALAEGLDTSTAERVFGFRQATITTWLTRAGEHAQTLHERFFANLRLPHLQLDELRTRLRCARQVLWLWLAIDPLTKTLPLLQLGPRTQTMAHLFIHTLRESLAPGCLPLFTSDGLNLSFYAALGSFWTLAPGGSERVGNTPVAGSGRLDLRPGVKMLPVLATWIIRSKTGTSRRSLIPIPCLQTQKGWCTIRSHQQHPHTRLMICSWNGEVFVMAGVLTSLRRLLDGCWHALSARLTHWTKPLTRLLAALHPGQPWSKQT